MIMKIISTGRKNQTRNTVRLSRIVTEIERIPNNININRTKIPKTRIIELNTKVSNKLLTLYSSFILIQGEKSVESRVGIEKKL